MLIEKGVASGGNHLRPGLPLSNTREFSVRPAEELVDPGTRFPEGVFEEPTRVQPLAPHCLPSLYLASRAWEEKSG